MAAHMRWLGWGSLALGLMVFQPSANAQGDRGRSFPNVIGATGRPYGPTQAEYQYQRRYGHPSPGSNGHGLGHVNGYPAGGSGYGFRGPLIPPYGPFYGWGPQFYPGFDPYGYQYGNYIDYTGSATYNGQGVYGSGAPAGPGLGLGLGLGNVLNPLFPMGPVPPSIHPLDGNGFAPPPVPGAVDVGNIGPAELNKMPVNPLNRGDELAPTPATIGQSSPERLAESYQIQTQGDHQLQNLNYLGASDRYRKAIDTARDRADPRYRLAVTLAARGRFFEANDQMRLAVSTEPGFPQICSSLDELFGAANFAEKRRLLDQTVSWVREDSRDPNRLFLMGAFLYLDGNPNARIYLDNAAMIAGQTQALQAFMVPRAVPIPNEAAASMRSPQRMVPVQQSGPQPTPAAMPTPAAAPTVPNAAPTPAVAMPKAMPIPVVPKAGGVPIPPIPEGLQVPVKPALVKPTKPIQPIVPSEKPADDEPVEGPLLPPIK